MKARLLATFAALSVFLLPAPAAFSQSVSETSVEAAFLAKFADYIDWSDTAFESPQTPFLIGVIGSDEIAANLSQLLPGRHIGTHPMTERVLREGESLRGVHLLFVGRDAAPHLRTIVKAAERQGTLVVTDSEGALEAGSSINFIVAANHVGFEVSTAPAERAGHRISARMLAVARRVVKGP